MYIYIYIYIYPFIYMLMGTVECTLNNEQVVKQLLPPGCTHETKTKLYTKIQTESITGM